MTLVELREDCIADSCPVRCDVLTCFVWLRFDWRLHLSSRSGFSRGYLGWFGMATVDRLVEIPISLQRSDLLIIQSDVQDPDDARNPVEERTSGDSV